ncbi:hypothetical protein, partial [Ralstonia solanacearum]|uniref:hypothetical protein n=1 Tax=Ralstonia solanacearum TaxID=305 RepID=UPI001E2F6B60
CLRLEIGHEPVCYPVRRPLHDGARVTIFLTASPTKMRTGSAVLIHADQVISLDMYVKSDFRRTLYIDDGELVENEIATPSQ